MTKYSRVIVPAASGFLAEHSCQCRRAASHSTSLTPMFPTVILALPLGVKLSIRHCFKPPPLLDLVATWLQVGAGKAFLEM